MKRIVIVGAGGFGRELFDWVYPEQSQYEIKGFIDDTQTSVLINEKTIPVLNTIKNYTPEPNEFLLLAIGNPLARQNLYVYLKGKGANFEKYIHKSAFVSSSASLSEGCIIGPFASVSANAHVGICSVLNFYANVGHDAHLGDFSVMSVHTNINGFSQIGSCVFIGGHGVVLPKVIVEDNATIGAGSVAMRKVRKGTTVVGVPAQKFM